MKRSILNAIERAQIISVFRHINPDHDALGSQWGLITWLKHKYPHKQIIACGFHQTVKGVEYPLEEASSDQIIESSLAIVLDSANQARIDDQRFALANQIIKIDHHPETDHYGDIVWVDPSKASTCEMVTSLLKDAQQKPLPSDVSALLLGGIMSDTIMFSIKSTSQFTLSMAAYLMESDVNINDIYQKLYHISLKDYHFINFIRSQATFHESGLLVTFVSHDDLIRHKMHPNLAKEYIYALANVHEVEVWALFIEIDVDDQWLYNGSIRSKNVAINQIAAQYNGGGHPLAAAVKHVTYKEALEILRSCEHKLKEAKHEH